MFLINKVREEVMQNDTKESNEYDLNTAFQTSKQAFSLGIKFRRYKIINSPFLFRLNKKDWRKVNCSSKESYFIITLICSQFQHIKIFAITLSMPLVKVCLGFT